MFGTYDNVSAKEKFNGNYFSEQPVFSCKQLSSELLLPQTQGIVYQLWKAFNTISTEINSGKI